MIYPREIFSGLPHFPSFCKIDGDMKPVQKILAVLGSAALFLTGSGFTNDDEETFDPDSLKNYQEEYKSTSVGVCSTSSTKVYEDYRLITSVSSAQYQYIHNHMTVDEKTGFLLNEDGFIGVAMGYLFGDIGTEYYIELDTGVTIPVVKVDAKAAQDATNGCSANLDASVIEFVIDSDIAYSCFGGNNGLVSNGNFNNQDDFNGNIQDIRLVSDEKIEDGVLYEARPDTVKKSDETADAFQPVLGGYSK